MRQRVPLPQFCLYLLILLAVQYWAGTVALVVRSPNLDALERALTQISVLPVVEWFMLFGFVRRLPDRTISATTSLRFAGPCDGSVHPP